MPLTEAKRRSNNKWDAENMTVLGCKVRKTYAEQVKIKAKEAGTTVNAIFLGALKEFMDDGDADIAEYKMPNAETLAAIAEGDKMLSADKGQHFKGSSEDFFTMLDDEDIKLPQEE